MTEPHAITVSERERRDAAAAASRLPIVALTAIVAAAAVLRCWNLGGGLPASLGVDEPQIMVRSLSMVKTGDFHPHFFDYPGLYLYLQAAVVVVRFLAGAAAGTWSSLAQVSDYDFYLWGRAVTAAFGTGTVCLAYLAGARWSVRHGLVAAAALAVLPIHVRESHFVLTDVPATFFVTLALVLSLRALERGTLSAFAWAGAAAGLAAGTKYTAWVAILLALTASALTAGPHLRRVQSGLAAVAGFLAAFLVVAPYTIIDLPGFLDGFGALAAAVPRRAASAEAGWLIYLKHLRIALGWPGVVLATGGLAVCLAGLVRGPARARFAMVLIFLAVFWSMVVDRTLIFARYLMPLLPFVGLLIAFGVVAAADRFGRKRTAGRVILGVLVAAALAQPLVSSAAFARQMGRRTTEALAMDWIRQNIGPGTRILHESASLHFPPGRYRIEFVRSLAEKGADFYAGGQVDCVVATSAGYGRSFANPGQFQEEYLAYRQVFDRLTLVHSVQPSPDHPGPEVRVFRVPR